MNTEEPQDSNKIVNRLPTREECRSLQHLMLRDGIQTTDDELAAILARCIHLESVALSGVPATTDRTIVLLASVASNLRRIDLYNCTQITDVGILELLAKSLPLECIRLDGVVGLTDACVSAIAKSCSRLQELELCGLPLLSPLSVRDVWSFSRYAVVVFFS
jgi:F-box and leucine-rich repeat protein GRR1